MNTKKKIAVRKLLSGVLVLLGFTACDSDGPGNELCEYGTPSADYQVKGKVLDQADKRGTGGGKGLGCCFCEG